jgi:peptide deformylase
LEEKMAIRKIRVMGDPCLEKVCKPVVKMNDNMRILVEDMFDTMYEAKGVGLAAPQVGILRRICVVDVMDGEPVVLINPEVIETSGEQTDDEGCLSVPGKIAEVTRPNHVVVKSLDMDMNPVTYEGEGLKARAFLHEMDHLEGILYGERASEPYRDIEEDEEFEEQEEL